MAVTETSTRIERVAAALQSAGADVYIAWSPVTLAYLHGLREQPGERFFALVINKNGQSRLICPALSEAQARRAGIQHIAAWRDGEDPVQRFRQLADDWSLRSAIIAVDNEMPAAMLLQLQGALPAALFKPGHEILAELMRIKDAAELQKMATAADIADRALQLGINAIRPGATEKAVAEVLSAAMRKLGGEPGFAIVATGANGAEPHHVSDNSHIQRGDVVVLDFGCSVEGYQSDITRTVSCGPASDEARKVYEIVFQAHQAARRAIRPGIPAAEIDRAARQVIENAGYGEFFVHRTGHGIGMRVHEDPYIVSTNAEPLREGECFSVEPGIYLPERFGVRIESIVTVTTSGYEALNAEPADELIETV